MSNDKKEKDLKLKYAITIVGSIATIAGLTFLHNSDISPAGICGILLLSLGNSLPLIAREI